MKPPRPLPGRSTAPSRPGSRLTGRSRQHARRCWLWAEFRAQAGGCPRRSCAAQDGVLWQQPGKAKELPKSDDRRQALSDRPTALRERYLREVWDACCNLKLTSIEQRGCHRRPAEAAGAGAGRRLHRPGCVRDAPPRCDGARAVDAGSEARAQRSATDRNRLPAMAAHHRASSTGAAGRPRLRQSPRWSDFVALCLAGEGLERDHEANRKRLGEASSCPRCCRCA